MAAGVLRPVEARAVGEFLAAAVTAPAGLVIEGEPGIGKTTLWLDVVERAESAGFRVLSGRAGPTEIRLAYAVLADLLGDVDPAALTDLPDVQRDAIDAVLSRAAPAGSTVDDHVIGAATRGIIERLAADGPVLLAVDDAQWLDASTAVVLAFAVRRLRGPIGILATVRSNPENVDTAAWLRLSRPDAVARTAMGPLTLSDLHALISSRLGLVLSRPTRKRIRDVSGGNPLYALELARATQTSTGVPKLPDTLKSLVRNRIGELDAEVRHVLLAVATAAEPTVALIAAACDRTVETVEDLLERAADQALIRIDGYRVRFTHPLLATGVYDDAPPAARRTMHRRLASLVDAPEPTARHMALAATEGDEVTLKALDVAAASAAARGAPTAAAELYGLAIQLGGDTPSRRLRAAEQHFRAGSIDDAHAALRSVIDDLPPGLLRSVALMLQGAVYGYGSEFARAVEVLTQAVAESDEIPSVRLRALLLLAPAIGTSGGIAESVEYAQRAALDADQFGNPALRSQAAALLTYLSFMHGLGVDEQVLRTAIELEDARSTAHVLVHGRAIEAVIASWSGNLVTARAAMLGIQQRCNERGSEVDVVWVADHLTMIDVWLGRYGEAAMTADDASERAEQIGGGLMPITALNGRAAVAAYQGRVDDVRVMASAAIDAARKIGALSIMRPATISRAFTEVSLGRYAKALEVLEPLIADFDATHGTEIWVGGYLPDAIEALTATSRLDEAEAMVDALQANGTRLDRPWMRATGARGRAHLLAAHGDLTGAERAAQHAMTEHDRLPMPFERARTQLLLGQLGRRLRRATAPDTIRNALATFEELGTPVWAERARADLVATQPGAPRRESADLTATERRIAELAAAGMSNREIAQTLFISPKTVEAHLSRIYRKLGVRSRTGLGRHVGERSG